MKESQLTVCLWLGLLLRQEAERCASASFIKHHLHKMNINGTNHSPAALYANYSLTHGWAPSQQCVWQGSCPALSCLSPWSVHTNATVCFSPLKSSWYNNNLLKPVLHGCMLAVHCMVMSQVLHSWLRSYCGLQRGICCLWFPYRVAFCASR